eukprot:86396-Chlamydomonas_euryale.AAC.2
MVSEARPPPLLESDPRPFFLSAATYGALARLAPSSTPDTDLFAHAAGVAAAGGRAGVVGCSTPRCSVRCFLAQTYLTRPIPHPGSLVRPRSTFEPPASPPRRAPRASQHALAAPRPLRRPAKRESEAHQGAQARAHAHTRALSRRHPRLWATVARRHAWPHAGSRGAARGQPGTADTAASACMAELGHAPPCAAHEKRAAWGSRLRRSARSMWLRARGGGGGRTPWLGIAMSGVLVLAVVLLLLSAGALRRDGTGVQQAVALGGNGQVAAHQADSDLSQVQRRKGGGACLGAKGGGPRRHGGVGVVKGRVDGRARG